MNEKKRQELASWLVQTKGLLNPQDQDAEIAKIAATCPEATAADEGLVDDVDKAYKVMQISMNAASEKPTESTQPVATSSPSSSISAAEELQISKTLLAQGQQRAATSANSTVESMIFDRPAPADIIKKGATGVIVKKSWDALLEKIDKGEYTVLADDGDNIDAEKRIASTTNFNTLKAAVEANKPVEIYIGELNKKPIGYIINKGTAVGSGNAPVQMTREEAERFLIMDTAGYILASDTKPGLKLRYVKGKPDTNNPGQTKPGKTILADANKKNAVEAGSYEISKDLTDKLVPTLCKSKLQFKVKLKDKFMKDGVTNLVRTVRVSLKADLPVLERKPQFVDVFGLGDGDNNNNLMEIPTGDQAKKIGEAQRNAIAQLRQKANDPTMLSDLKDISDKLAAFDAPAQQAPAGVQF